MAERVAGVLGGDGERKHARAPAVSDDDLGLARVADPLERDHVAGIVACVEFHKHAWLLSGSGVAYGCGQRDLMAPTLRFLVRDRARGHAWCLPRGRRLPHGGCGRVPLKRAPVRTAALAVGEGAVWVVDRADGTLARVDPDKN